MSKYQIILNMFSRKFCVDLEKHVVRQYVLFKLLTSWKNSLDRSGFVSSIIMDFSKVYDYLPHDLLFAKLQAYGFSKEIVSLFLSYLTNRTQRIKIDSTLSDWRNILKGIPQGSVLGPLLFNIFINDLFFFSAKCEICKFADDNSLFSCGLNLHNTFSNLIQDMKAYMNGLYTIQCKQILINFNLLS